MRIFVGLSGGVDSAVSAALLKEKGHDVVGAFIRIWRPEFLECTWKEDRLDAMRVCASLGIPFREVDLSLEYEREVVRTMIDAYSAGITPNPDVLCNREIKFGHFARWALESGADMIATGHYARIDHVDVGLRKSHILLRGSDRNKDQSYFIYQMNQGDLSHTLFPVGDLQKSAVRSLATTFDLPVAAKHDSQGLCFVGDVSMKEFLSRYIPLRRGDVVDERGNVVGKHDGAALYTIGERHGFSAAGTAPHYVVGTDVQANIVRVSTRREDAMRKEIIVHDIHWIAGAPSFPLMCDAQARYRETPFKVTVSEPRPGLGTRGPASTHIVTFDEPRIAAPGQSLVLYEGDVCLGGGSIGS